MKPKVLLLGVFLSSAALAEGEVPCSDASPPTIGCPDLVVDASTMRPFVQQRTFGPTSCSVIEGETLPGSRTLLRFTFTTPNLGAGDLVVGSPEDHPEWFELSTCHGHFHFREYADYRLWTLEGFARWLLLRAENPGVPSPELLREHPDLLSELVTGEKRGFCVIDVRRYLPTAPIYQSCSGNQGIIVGWADEYHWSLDGQWVDVTDVPSGDYVLEAEVNAERLYVESEYANNSAAVRVRLP
ncbi:MAG: lysyl oxidase family protein [Candidatus Binatia bacterium]